MEDAKQAGQAFSPDGIESVAVATPTLKSSQNSGTVCSLEAQRGELQHAVGFSTRAGGQTASPHPDAGGQTGRVDLWDAASAARMVDFSLVNGF